MQDKYDLNLDKRPANHQPMTPLHFLLRAAETWPDRIAAIYGERRYSWRDYATRCRKLSAALIAAGVGKGDTVSIFAPNTLAMLEAQFGVPMSGAVLNCLNSRLDAAGVRFVLEHSEARVLFVDCQFAAIARDALTGLATPPLVIDIADDQVAAGEPVGDIEYEAFLAGGDAETPINWPTDEWDAIALNYTSGTTGDPKGVVYHHRGAYLNALGQVINGRMTDRPAGLSLDIAALSLQRLVLCLGAGGRRRNPGLPAQGQRRAHLRRHRAPRGDAVLRRADRARLSDRRLPGDLATARRRRSG